MESPLSKALLVLAIPSTLALSGLVVYGLTSRPGQLHNLDDNFNLDFSSDDLTVAPDGSIQTLSHMESDSWEPGPGSRFYGIDTEDDPEWVGPRNAFSELPDFNLLSYGCYHSFFPGVKPPNNIEKPVVRDLEEENIKDYFEKIQPSAQGVNSQTTKPSVGCSAVRIKQKDDLYLIRSEMVLKSDNFAIVHWFSAKNLPYIKYTWRSFIQFNHYLLLLEKVNGAWNIRAGAAWGPSKLKFINQSQGYNFILPHGLSHTMDIFSKTGNRVRNRVFYNVWVENPNAHGDEPGARQFFNPDWFSMPVKSYYITTDYDMRSIKGYGADTTFFYHPDSYSEADKFWKWSRLKPKGKEEAAKFTISPLLEKWLSKFQRREKTNPWGSWYFIKPYCGLKRDLWNEDLKPVCESWVG